MASWFFSIGLVVAFLVCRLSYAQVENALPLDDPNAVVRAILSALQAMEQPVTGRGRAVMRIENYLEEYENKELIALFVFRDQKSRVDIFESNGAGGVGSRLRARAKSDKAYCETVSDSAWIELPKRYDHAVGKDFHPATFFDFLGASLEKTLKNQLTNPNLKKSVELNQEGILCLFSSAHAGVRRGKDYNEEIQLGFDTQKGLRPVCYERIFRCSDGSWSARKVNLQWARFDSAWYVSAFEYSELPSNHLQVVGTVESFSPNAKVSDEEFTLESLGVPDGALVVDEIAGVRYRYGTTVNHLETGNDEDVSVTTTTDQMQIRTLWPSGIVIAGIVVFIGVVAFIGYRYFVT